MTNHYENCREGVLIDISEELERADILTLYDVRKLLQKNRPLFIREYIDKFWDNHSVGFRDDLEYELRKFWLKLSGEGCGCHKIESNGYFDHFQDLIVEGQPLDIWIMEQGTEFNPADIAHAIYKIYIGKVTFSQ